MSAKSKAVSKAQSSKKSEKIAGKSATASNKVEQENTKIIWVEALSQYKMMYAMRVPASMSKSEVETLAAQKTADGSINEISQLHLGEVVLGVQEVSEEEYLKRFDEHNDYLHSWDDGLKLRQIDKEPMLMDDESVRILDDFLLSQNKSPSQEASQKGSAKKSAKKEGKSKKGGSGSKK